MPDALDRDFSDSQAVLIGTWDYHYLHSVPAARYSLRRMHTLLTGPLCGWPDERVHLEQNRNTLGDLPRQLVEKLRPVRDVALFYYVGHGQYDYDDRLCLSLVDSHSDPDLRTTTSLPFDTVRHAFRISRARTKIAILDCCFAGLAAGDDGRLATTNEPPLAPGCYLMMASGEFSTAWFETTNENEQPQTYFTKYLAEVVERGIPDQPEGLTLGPIFDRVADQLVHDGKPIPTRRISDHAAHHTFARNAAIHRSVLAEPGEHNDEADPATEPGTPTEVTSDQTVEKRRRGVEKPRRGVVIVTMAWLILGIILSTLFALFAQRDESSPEKLSDYASTFVNAVAFGPDLRVMATERKGIVRLWKVRTNTATGTARIDPQQGFGPGGSWMTWSPNGSHLAVIIDGAARIWDVSANKQVGYFSDARCAAFSPDGTTLATCSDRSILLRDVRTGKPVAELNLRNGFGSQPDAHLSAELVAFSPDGRHLAVANNRGNVAQWDMDTRQPVRQPLDTDMRPGDLVYSPDGKLLAMVSTGDDMRVWNAGTGKSLSEFSGEAQAVAFSSDGTLMATANYQKDGGMGSVILWNTAHRSIVQRFSPTYTDTSDVADIAFTPNGRTVVSSNGTQIDRWKSLSGPTTSASR